MIISKILSKLGLCIFLMGLIVGTGIYVKNSTGLVSAYWLVAVLLGLFVFLFFGNE